MFWPNDMKKLWASTCSNNPPGGNVLYDVESVQVERPKEEVLGLLGCHPNCVGKCFLSQGWQTY